MSDNTAANLLLPVLGGPAGLTAWCRSLGDSATRLDRIEPFLNESLPGDERDTTTPAAMLGLMEKLFLGGALKPASREHLEQGMIAAKPGPMRLAEQKRKLVARQRHERHVLRELQLVRWMQEHRVRLERFRTGRAVGSRNWATHQHQSAECDRSHSC